MKSLKKLVIIKLKNQNNMDKLHYLTILFVGLKLTGFIDWSWFYIVLPSTITGAYYLIMIGLGIWSLIIDKQNKDMIEEMSEKRKSKSKFQQRLDDALEKAKQTKPNDD